MSKTAARGRFPAKHKTDTGRTTLAVQCYPRKLIVGFAVAVVLAGIPFGIGKYIEFNSPGAFDSGAYVYSAAYILAGAKIGVEEKPSAQIGTLLVNILGVWLFSQGKSGPEMMNDIGPKLLQAILQAAALVLMFIAMRKLFGVSPAIVGVVVASVYLSSPLSAKYGNVKEQFMIAFMVMGMSCFVLYQLRGRWWLAFLAGGFLIWAPLFKPTGMSAIGGAGLFVIAQPFLRNRSFRQTGIDILLFAAGAAAAMAPLYIWIIGWKVQLGLPYAFVWVMLGKVFHSAFGAAAAGGAAGTPPAGDYLDMGRSLVSFAEQWPRVLRYYGVMILPISLAVSSIILRVVRLGQRVVSRSNEEKAAYERFVLLFGGWWVLDMAFVWVSPLSFEEYYLPLNASSAMLGGYFVAIFLERFSRKLQVVTTGRSASWDVGLICTWVLLVWWGVHKIFVASIEAEQLQWYGQYRMIVTAAISLAGLAVLGLIRDGLSKGVDVFRWALMGIVGVVCVVMMGWHVFFGIETSPYSGTKYRSKEKGFAQRLEEISQRRRTNDVAPWETVGLYIREHSTPQDKIYVWGWFPGIYVIAERFSSTTPAFMMPRPAPAVFEVEINQMVEDFRKEPPKFMVDSRKRDIPTERPPYDLWPIAPQGFMGVTNAHFVRSGAEAQAHDKQWSKYLQATYGDDEADRYDEMKPLREFIMNNYEPVEPQYFVETRGWQRLLHRMFGEHIVFRLKESAGKKEQQ